MPMYANVPISGKSTRPPIASGLVSGNDTNSKLESVPTRIRQRLSRHHRGVKGVVTWATHHVRELQVAQLFSVTQYDGSQSAESRALLVKKTKKNALLRDEKEKKLINVQFCLLQPLI